jgi:hypothetical protein
VAALQATLGELGLAGGRETSGERVAERVPAE